MNICILLYLYKMFPNMNIVDNLVITVEMYQDKFGIIKFIY